MKRKVTKTKSGLKNKILKLHKPTKKEIDTFTKKGKVSVSVSYDNFKVEAIVEVPVGEDGLVETGQVVKGVKEAMDRIISRATTVNNLKDALAKFKRDI